MLIYILCIFVAILFDLGFSHFEYQHIASSIFRLFVGFIATDCGPKVKICTVCKCWGIHSNHWIRGSLALTNIQCTRLPMIYRWGGGQATVIHLTTINLEVQKWIATLLVFSRVSLCSHKPVFSAGWLQLC